LAPVGSDIRYHPISGGNYPSLVEVKMLFLVMDANKVRALSACYSNFDDRRFGIGHDRTHGHAQIRKGSNQIINYLDAALGEGTPAGPKSTTAAGAIRE
jgi:hypothetical protein